MQKTACNHFIEVNPGFARWLCTAPVIIVADRPVVITSEYYTMMVVSCMMTMSLTVTSWSRSLIGIMQEVRTNHDIWASQSVLNAT